MLWYVHVHFGQDRQVRNGDMYSLLPVIVAFLTTAET